MGEVINLRDRVDEWKEVFTIDCEASTLQVYVSVKTGEAEVVQSNDDGESVRTCMSAQDLYNLVEVLNKHRVTSD